MHVVSGLSKDFPFGALRVGCLISQPSSLLAVSRAMGRFSAVSAHTMSALTPLLSETAFVDTYMLENRKALARRHAAFWAAAEAHGLPLGRSLPSEAGLFVWLDLREFMPDHTYEAEEQLWRNILEHSHINITRGEGCLAPEPGWFRVCICHLDDNMFSIAIARLFSALEQLQPEAAPQSASLSA
eukprot:SAG11_NODE_4443_length_1893_cov_1.060758_2_plen_185_part_00